MYYILPKTVTDSTFVSSSVSEDPSPLWVLGTSYAVGAEVHLLTTHRVYKASAAMSPSTVSPDVDPLHWQDMRPTNKWGAHDLYTGTKTRSVTSLSFSVQYGIFNAVALYGLEGAQFSLTATEGVGGPVYWSASGYLYDHTVGWYGYFFSQRVVNDRLAFTDIPLKANGVLTVTVTNSPGEAVACGMCSVGSLNALIGSAPFGGTDWGAEAEPVTYSYLEPSEDGTLKIVRRFSATNLNAAVRMPREYADQAVRQLQYILDVPVAWTATKVSGYSGLSTFGLGSGRVVYDNYGFATMNLRVAGIV